MATTAAPAPKKLKTNNAEPMRVRSASSQSKLADWSDTHFFLLKTNDNSLVTKYTLLDLLTDEKVQPVHKRVGKVDKDMSATDYVKKILPGNPLNFDVTCDQQLHEICCLKYPNFVSLDQRPDV